SRWRSLLSLRAVWISVFTRSPWYCGWLLGLRLKKMPADTGAVNMGNTARTITRRRQFMARFPHPGQLRIVSLTNCIGRHQQPWIEKAGRPGGLFSPVAVIVRKG